MNELNPNTLENLQPRTPEELVALNAMREKMERQKQAGEVLDDKETQAQEPGRKFDSGPSSAHADKIAEIVNPKGAENADSDNHEEVPGMKLPNLIRTEKERAEAATILISSPPDTRQAGVANQLQEQMEKLYSEQDKAE